MVLALGAHMSIAGGHQLALERAAELEMSACQIFTKNANQWNAKPLDPAVGELFRAAREAAGIAREHVVAHDSYLINIASPDDALWEKSRLALMDELDRCDLLDVPYLVAHPGGHMGAGVEAGIRRIADAINRIHDERPEGRAALLLETTAGQGTTLGKTFEELARMIELVHDKKRIGVCFDTCHVFVAGYDLRDRESYEETMRQFEQTIGFQWLRAIHLNDSVKGLGSHVDRHAAIGAGELGLTAFELLLNDERLNGLPGILETPKGKDNEEDRRNLATLRSLIKTPA
ncbi:MAG TPA: deoxyribonuclease IV [Thermomicrobiales bacterium]